MTSLKKNPGLLDLANKIIQKRQSHSYTATLKNETINFINEIIDFFFPHCSGRIYFSTDDALAKLKLLQRDLQKLLKELNGNLGADPAIIAEQFIEQLPAIHDKLWSDAEFINQGDPASEDIDEVILAYPGFTAIVIYRVANILFNLKVPIIPRIMTEHAHQITGIDIHPGAEIGSPFFIDHGTGIVIGETTIIGKNVKIYQGVTLGALSVDKNLAQTKRHPTIEENVVIYAQAVILGGSTTIGANSVIGGNAWITESIPANSVVYNKSEVKVRSNKELNEPINFII